VRANVAQSLRDSSLGVRIDRGRRFDEDQYLGVGQLSRAQTETLALSTGEASTPLFNEGVESVFQGLEECRT